jgi:protein SCO1
MRFFTRANAIFILAIASVFYGCAKQPQVKHYPLHGKVMSVDKLGHELIIDSDAIPGFMQAMTMGYPVADNAMLLKVNPGDEIKADLAVSDQHIAIDQLTVMQKAAPGTLPNPTKPMHVPQAGEAVPNFVLTNQSGRHIHMEDYRGKALLITFFYTRCPLNDFCPRMNGNFAALNKTLADNPPLYAKTHLLSISFDSQHDTPKVLRSYGGAYTERYSKEDFKHWEFATAPGSEMKRIADFFGVYYQRDGQQIVHSLSTAVITPNGEVEAWYPGNHWQPQDLIGPIKTALTASASAGQARAASSPPSSTN